MFRKFYDLIFLISLFVLYFLLVAFMFHCVQFIICFVLIWFVMAVLPELLIASIVANNNARTVRTRVQMQRVRDEGRRKTHAAPSTP